MKIHLSVVPEVRYFHRASVVQLFELELIGHVIHYFRSSYIYFTLSESHVRLGLIFLSYRRQASFTLCIELFRH